MQKTLVIAQRAWEEFQDWFTDDERLELALATIGESASVREEAPVP